MRCTVLSFVLSLLVFSLAAQEKFYIGTDGDYSILVNEGVTTKVLTPPSGGYVDYYLLREDDEFVFLLSVRKVGVAAQSDLIYQKDFLESLLNECKCEFLGADRVSFTNFNALKVSIKTELNGKIVRGYTVAAVESGMIFNVNFLSLESKFNFLELEFEKMMDHLVFK